MKAASSLAVRALPRAARRRLWLIGTGWVLVAALEAAAYTVLAMAIAGRAPAVPVLLAAAVNRVAVSLQRQPDVIGRGPAQA